MRRQIGMRYSIATVIVVSSCGLTGCAPAIDSRKQLASEHQADSSRSVNAGYELIAPRQTGPYLGQDPPGNTPEIFAPGIVSTERNEINSVFSPDGREFYFSSFDRGRGYTMMVMSEEEEGWTKPQPVSFSSAFSEVDMFISPDGFRLFFLSKRPLEPNGERPDGYQIWVTERVNGSWGKPRHLGATINGGKRQLYPSVTGNGLLYFNSTRVGFGKGDLFRSRLENGSYLEPENLGPAINTEYDETDVLIAPDERWIIFTSLERPDGYGNGDLYISFQTTGGAWTLAKNMGDRINSPSSEFCPALSPDGQYFFFTSRRRGSDDIYWVSSEILEGY